MPRVRLSSMYDLQTNTKFGIIGVHTPSTGQLATKYDGLLKNYKYMKVKSCSVKIACASVLPADPSQVGVTAGKISPADMMNPILYRAVSNDSWNLILNRIYSSGWSGDAADGHDDGLPISQGNSEKVYYSLLSSPGWRKVMPQQGLSVKGLKPLVHEVVSVFGQQSQPSGDWVTDWQNSIANGAAVAGGTGQPAISANLNTVFRGKTLPMPAIPTTQVVGDSSEASLSTSPAIPKTMVLCIVMPFSQLQVMYYRMIVTWDIVFFGLRPATEIDLNTAIADGAYDRYSRWTISTSKELESDRENEAATVGCVDALNMSPDLKMES